MISEELARRIQCVCLGAMWGVLMWDVFYNPGSVALCLMLIIILYVLTLAFE
jgi:uncharacterized membrane protein YgaE (UPF0421/DUF939 family)